MKEIFDHLEAFDKAHGWDRYNKITNDKDRLDALQIEIINLLGELGEFANQLKKDRRNNTLSKELLAEEATDMFIFLLKIAKTLDIDLEKTYYAKMRDNEKRFSNVP